MTFQELHNNLKARCKKAAAEGRPFEDLFSAFQSEMIRQGIALAENRAEKIYIYSDLEDGAFTAQPLFRINGEYYTEGGIAKAVNAVLSFKTREERYKMDDHGLCSCRPLAVQRLWKRHSDCDQTHLRCQNPPSESAIRLRAVEIFERIRR